MDQLVNIVGMNIREIRKQKEMTQEDLAEQCGLQTSYVAGVERGERNITLQTMEKIANGLGVVAQQLFNLEAPMRYLSNQTEFRINIFTDELKTRSEKEVDLIINIANDIFNTYK